MFLDVRLFANFYKYKRKVIKLVETTANHARQISTATKTTIAQNDNPLKVLFFGTDNFSLPSLKELHKSSSSNYNIEATLGAVTSFKSPANCIRVYAEKQKLPLFRWPVTADICAQYDLGVVVSFGHMIPTHIIKAFPLGMINVHASLLPRWRGAAPIIYAMMHGDALTGVSIMRIEPKHFDIGDILAQETVPIEPNQLMPQLHERLANVGANLLTQVIKGYPVTFENNIKQNEPEVTLAPKISVAVTEVNWRNMSATMVYNRWRALYTFKPLISKFQGKQLQLIELKLPDIAPAEGSNLAAVPGSLQYRRDTKSLRICCAQNSYIDVLQVRIEGKKSMTAMDFNNGFLRKLEAHERCFGE